MHHLNHLIWESLFVSARSFQHTALTHSLTFPWCSVLISRVCVHVCMVGWLTHATLGNRHGRHKNARKTLSLFVAGNRTTGEGVKSEPPNFGGLLWCDEFNLWYSRSANVEMKWFWCATCRADPLKQSQKWCMHQLDRERERARAKNKIHTHTHTHFIHRQTHMQREWERCVKCASSKNNGIKHSKNARENEQNEGALLHAANHIRRPLRESWVSDREHKSITHKNVHPNSTHTHTVGVHMQRQSPWIEIERRREWANWADEGHTSATALLLMYIVTTASESSHSS